MTAVHRILIMNGADEVGVCVEEVPAETPVSVGDGVVVTRQRIPAGHKVALVDLAAGSPVHKYGQPIGFATADIRRGEHVHLHNLDSGRVGGNRH